MIYPVNEDDLILDEKKGESLDTYTILKQILHIMIPSMINLFL